MAGAAGDAIANWFRNPDLLLVDEPRPGGPIWVRGNNYKASFEPGAWQFLAQAAPEAAEAQSIRFAQASASVGGEQLATHDVAPTRSEQRIEYRHETWTEAIDLRGREVEQTFTFRQLPRRGELVIDLLVDARLPVQATAQGLEFADPWYRIRYGKAVAIDANGERIDAVTTWGEGHIGIRVPAEFVARAALPLVVDPVISSTNLSPNTYVGSPDVAWDEATQAWGMCFVQLFQPGDWDCYLARLDANLGLLTMTTIDFTTAWWWVPKVANCRAAGRFLVVANVWLNVNSGPAKVTARMTDSAGTATAQGQFDIVSTARDELNPDVGGDPVATGPTFFTVVWEDAYSAFDHDIWARQVDANGNLRGAGPTPIQANASNQSHPTISKSDGGLPVATQRFTVVYQETLPLFPGSYENVSGAMLTWDGVVVPVNGSPVITFSAMQGIDQLVPTVSSPSLPDANGNRAIVCTTLSGTVLLGYSTILGFVFDQSGANVQFSWISWHEDPARLNWPKDLPRVECDGHRFLITYMENYNGSPDLDTVVTTAVPTGNPGTPLQVLEANLSLGVSADNERLAKVATRYTGSGLYSPSYCIVDELDTSGAHILQAFNGVACLTGGISQRSSGCGGYSVSPTAGFALPGTSLTFTVNSMRLDLPGFVIGSPMQATPIPGCPGCTLGVNGSASLGRSLTLAIPLTPILVGLPVSLQGFVFGNNPGPCIGSLSLTNTIDIVVQ